MRIIITGANSGIGRDAALHLARSGHEVVATTRSRDRAAKLVDVAAAEGLDVALVELDVTDDDSVAECFGQVLRDGPIDGLVNNAGVGSNASLEDATMDHWHDVFETNVHGPIRCTQAVLPGMRERGAGRICMVSSVVGRFASVGQAAYTSSKWAMEGYSEVLALEVARFGIRVSIVEPGLTRTAILAKNTESPQGAYGDAYRRMFAMYGTLIPDAPGPEATSVVIEAALTSDEARLRWRSGRDADAMLDARSRMSDADFLGLATADDEEYRALWREWFDIDLAKGWPA